MDEKPILKVDTPFGPIWLHGRLTGRPVMLAITGAFNDADTMMRLPAVLPEVDVLVAHLPGNHCPPLVAQNIGLFGGAFDFALRQVLTDQPLVVLGISTGALAALCLNLPNLKRLVLVEPPLRTHDAAWIYRDFPQDGDKADFVWNIFGVRGDEVEPRDYMHLLDRLETQTAVLLGSEPLLPPRPWDDMPSLVDETVRAALAAHPQVVVIDAPGVGHNIPYKAPLVLLDILKRSVAGLGRV